MVERGGCVARLEGLRIDERARAAAAVSIARPLGYDADERDPLVDARLPDGSRVAISCPPVVPSHALTVRRFGSPPLSLEDLIRMRSVDPLLCEAAIRAIHERHNVLVSGGTGSGKTTLMQALVCELDPVERVIVIEDTLELELAGLPNVLRYEAREKTADRDALTVRQLVRHVLRHWPDRIIVGEVRGAEALDLLQALNTGHGGAVSTIHAQGAERAPARLASCAMQAGGGLPWDVVCQRVGQWH